MHLILAEHGFNGESEIRKHPVNRGGGKFFEIASMFSRLGKAEKKAKEITEFKYQISENKFLDSASSAE